MGCRIGDNVWLRSDTGLAGLRGRVGTNVGKVGDVWVDGDGEHISVVYEDERILALDVAASEFLTAGPIRASSIPPTGRGDGAPAARVRS